MCVAIGGFSSAVKYWISSKQSNEMLTEIGTELRAYGQQNAFYRYLSSLVRLRVCDRNKKND